MTALRTRPSTREQALLVIVCAAHRISHNGMGPMA